MTHTRFSLSPQSTPTSLWSAGAASKKKRPTTSSFHRPYVPLTSSKSKDFSPFVTWFLPCYGRKPRRESCGCLHILSRSAGVDTRQGKAAVLPLSFLSSYLSVSLYLDCVFHSSSHSFFIPSCQEGRESHTSFSLHTLSK